MISREDLRELSQFPYPDAGKQAVSFYFQPHAPRNKAHRDEVIHAKDMVRNAMREVTGNGNHPGLRDVMAKVCALAEQWQGEASRGRAVFACGKSGFWREFDLPSRLPSSQIFIKPRFHLKPLAVLFGAQPRLGIAVVDRRRARFFELRGDELTEHTSLFHSLSRRGRSDGFSGYDAGHAERQVADDVLHHYKQVAAALRQQLESGIWEKWILGCREVNWPELEPHLPPGVKQQLLGRFHTDLAALTNDEVKQSAARIFHQALDCRRRHLVGEAVARARGHRHGVTGLRRVLRALELGEVQTLLMGENFLGRAVECTRCGHLDSHLVAYCPLCGSLTRAMEDVAEGIIPLAIQRDVELLYVNDAELDSAGNIAALLRYRVETARAAGLSA